VNAVDSTLDSPVFPRSRAQSFAFELATALVFAGVEVRPLEGHTLPGLLPIAGSP